LSDNNNTDQPDPEQSRVILFTDGACSGNPGPGGWGALLRYGTHEKELSGGEPATTNNRMEMLAVINGLEALKRPAQVQIYTDSQYVMKGMTEWLAGWKRRGWKTVPPIDIVVTHDVVLAQITARLHLDDFQRNLAGIGQAVRTPTGM
jgi:ribonuclease HI